MPEFITICEQAARAGGAILLSWQGRISAKEKGPNDLVTEADLASQDAIQRIILDAFPDHEFVGEEDTSAISTDRHSASISGQGFRWIVDPLDGTTNFVHQFQAFSVSVALERAGELLVGAVFDPISQECFTAELGKGAMLNGRQLKTSDCQKLANALVAASFSANVPRDSQEITRFIEVLHTSQAVRRLGSAALNLCYLAAGRLDGYFASSVKTWDVAAGLLLVREAGGVVTALNGEQFDLDRPNLTAAATTALHGELLTVLEAA